MTRSDIATGGQLRHRFGARNPAVVFGTVGAVLLAAGAAVPEFQALLLAWGGTAVFAALLLQFVFAGRTVPAAVASDIYASMAGNARTLTADEAGRYVSGPDGVTLAVGDRRLEPVGKRLLADVSLPDRDASVEERLSVLADVVVTDFELAASIRATRADSGVTVTVGGSSVGTAEVYDHPVASVFGVALAEHADAPVRVDSTVDGDRLVVTCRWSEPRQELLDGSNPHQTEKHQPADDQR